jgi:PadR family transcriptional regulator PadR
MSGLTANLLYGSVDLIILKILSHGGPRHGLAVLQEIERISRGGLRLAGNALYPALHRLEEKGLVACEWRVSEKGRRAKFYALTPAGERRLHRSVKEWLRYTDTVRDLLTYAEGDLS